jgi:hypothetical protein
MRIVERLFRLVWLTVLVGHGMAAVLAWWLLPGGFPLWHPRFWSNSVAPLFILGLSVAAVWALHRQPLPSLRAVLLAWIWFWVGIIVAAKSLFPVTFQGVWLIPIAVVFMAGLMTARVCTVPPRTLDVTAVDAAMALASIVVGAFLVWTQKPPASQTHPLFHYDPLSAQHALVKDQRPSGIVRLNSQVMAQASDASVIVRLAPLTLTVQPLLTFISRSADGAPTVLVARDQREDAKLELRGGVADGPNAYRLDYNFAGEGSVSLELEAPTGQTGEVDIESHRSLVRQIYSHLNSFCDFEIRGHTRLALEFSPCPGVPVEVLPVDYPFGRPARFAFVDAVRNFRIVEGTSGEKGPFHDLARGRLEPDQPLSITIHDNGWAVARITLDDWSSQADTTLSPSAGWGVPVNAIEFSLSQDSERSPASIFITLAGTSVGRGWDCVGHRSGTYRNRMHLAHVSAAD